jgi:hypothetical protein
MSERDFRARLERYRAVLDDALEAKLKGLLGGLSNGASFLVSLLSDGKKIRGCLTCVIGEALGASLDSLIPRAVAIEMIQAASLVHDDFIDQDRVRRGRPAVWTVEGPRKAVLLGDVIFATAVAMMSETSREDGLAAARAIALVSAGALREPLAPGDLAALVGEGGGHNGVYEKIIRLKTGVLFGAACEVGAVAASAPGKVREAARRYGILTGEAYQIADDLKDVKMYVSQGFARPEQVVAIAPTLLRFAEGSAPRILRFLEKGALDVTDGMLDLMMAVQKPMEEEIGSRLRSAASEIEGCVPGDAAGIMAREAPWGAISLFNES